MKLAKRSTITADFVFDIETESWDKFVCGGLFDVSTGDFFHSPRGPDGEGMFAHECLALKGSLWAHNAGRFDTLWLAKWVAKLGYEAEVFASSARITLMKVGKLEVRDLAALVPMKLADAAAIGGSFKLGVGLECICPGFSLGKDCGGYCRIRRDMPDADYDVVVKYMEQDCRAAAACIKRLQEFAEEKDLDLKGTIGASSWSAAARWQSIPKAKWSERHYVLARKGYYGGRTQVFQPDAPRGHHYDITSAYPAALTVTDVPVGKPTERSGKEAARAYDEGLPGIYSATVEVDEDMHIPPLPVRDKKGRVRYPIGRFAGTWCANELRYAENFTNTHVLGFGTSLVWPRAEKIMKEPAERVWALRDEAGKGSPMGKWLKFYANSLTGKLAQRPDTKRCVMNPEAGETFCPANGQCMGVLCGLSDIGCCPHRCIGTCGKYEELGFGSGIWQKPEWRIPANGYVQWAGYLTASARIELHRQLISDGRGGATAVYCDTDSCFATIQRGYNIGDKHELGKWHHEGFFYDFTALAPKTYRYTEPDGTRVVRSKGIAEPNWDDLVNRRPTVMDRGVNQFRTAARSGNLFSRRHLSRSLKFDGIHYGDRVIGKHGLTNPQRLGE